MTVGYRDPAHWSKAPLPVVSEFVNSEADAKDLRAKWREAGLSVRITKLVNFKRMDGTKVFYWKVQGWQK